MRVCSSQLFLLASSLVTISSAISPGPERLETTVTTLERRATGEEHDSINVEIGCSNGEHCCNADCYTILCLGGPNPVQYGRGNATPNRENSGFSSNLLQVAQRTREAWGIFIADNILDRIGRSVEESIMVNTFQGGEGEISIPTQPDENMRIGRRVGNRIKANHVRDTLWYYKVFQNFGNMAPYCSAVQAPGGRDLSICKRSDKNDDDPVKTAFVHRQSMDDNGHETFHMLDADVGERWTNKL